MTTLSYGTAPRTAPNTASASTATSRREARMDFLFAVTPIMLFIGGFAGEGRKALPYFVVALLVAVTQWRLILSPRGMQIAGSPALLLFMCAHLGLAFYTSVGQGIYRVAQMASAYVFIVPFVVCYSQRSMKRFFKYSSILLAVLMIGTIGWHVTHRHLVTWKYLWDTKTAYSLLPFLALAFVTSKTHAARLYGPALMGVVAVIILLSGERKAYILLGVALLLMANLRNPLTYLAPMAILIIGPLAAAIDTSGYVTRQIGTLTGFAHGDVVQTLSNQQREWQLNYIMELSRQHPVIGLGTGSYVTTMVGTYASSESPIIRPGIGVHGEFLRVLVENGALGMVAWIILVVSSASAAMLYARERPRGLQERKLATFLFISVGMYMMFEAFDTTMAVVYCLLPHIWRLRLVTPQATPVMAAPMASPMTPGARPAA